MVSTRIIAALRNRKFFSLDELNRAIRQKLDEHNKTPFTKREGQAGTVCSKAREKAFLHKLPTAQFELAQWESRHGPVQLSYFRRENAILCSLRIHQAEGRCAFNKEYGGSVLQPKQDRFSPRRLCGHPGQYSTVEAHMPEDHTRNTCSGMESVSSAGRSVSARPLQLQLRVSLPPTKSSSRATKAAWVF